MKLFLPGVLWSNWRLLQKTNQAWLEPRRITDKNNNLEHYLKTSAFFHIKKVILTQIKEKGQDCIRSRVEKIQVLEYVAWRLQIREGQTESSDWVSDW